MAHSAHPLDTALVHKYGMDLQKKSMKGPLWMIEEDIHI